jgi:hypothetical protein
MTLNRGGASMSCAYATRSLAVGTPWEHGGLVRLRAVTLAGTVPVFGLNVKIGPLGER